MVWTAQTENWDLACMNLYLCKLMWRFVFFSSSIHLKCLQWQFLFLYFTIFRASLKLNIMPQKRRLPHNKKAPLSSPQQKYKEYLVGPSKYSFGSRRYECWKPLHVQLVQRCSGGGGACDQYISIAPSASLHQLLLDDCSGFSRMAHELAETTLPRRWMRQVYVPSLNSLATSRRSRSLITI